MRLALSMLALGLLWAGCMSQYSPAAPVAPLLTHRGQVVAAARFRPVYPTRGVSAHVAAAPSEHSRLYLSGTWSRARGVRSDDYSSRILREHNNTRQLELGAGWGEAGAAFRKELLAGVGYGHVDAAGCYRDEFQGYSYCEGWWVDGTARFGRVFVQPQMAWHVGLWTGGGGLRLGYAHYVFERQFGRPSDYDTGLFTIEPFMVHRIDVPFGAIEVMLHIPFLIAPPYVEVPQGNPLAADQGTTHRERLFQIPMPRLYVGLQGNLDALWN